MTGLDKINFCNLFFWEEMGRDYLCFDIEINRIELQDGSLVRFIVVDAGCRTAV
ncbi:hypothetical protein [Prevotella phocaeensis]|uniref:hypothetical protein n=1 Tax=Prevotella phocaeensis TaxID=1776388 RepID=UPI000429B7E2|nr:hypothetical protein [Prevotella phocaeensis]